MSYLTTIGTYVVDFMMFTLFLLVHLFPILQGYWSLKYLEQKQKDSNTVYYIIIFSLIPTGLYLYITYIALTCSGGGCFSGLFYMASLYPALICVIINLLYWVFIKFRYK
ncbi:hypothetical protein JU57_13415 [Sulfurospirillum sp. SCADC]|nr:hypothetical protein JU57_13415 [Sulfurospirillum sp. SCADC]